MTLIIYIQLLKKTMWANMGLEDEIGEHLMNEFRGLIFLFKTKDLPIEEFNRMYHGLYKQAMEKAKDKEYVEKSLIEHYISVTKREK